MPDIVERRRNGAPWLAFAFTLLAIGLTAASFVAPVDWTKIIIWLSLAAGFGALVYAIRGVSQAFGRPQVFGGKISASIFGVLALLVCGILGFAWFSARALPPSTGAPRVGQKISDFTLADTNGNQVSLAALLGHADPSAAASASGAAPKAVLLIFYRGYW
jgi:hypothetical protein